MVPNQRMTFASDSLFGSPFQNLVGVLVIWFPPMTFICGPIKTERAVIEQRGETLAVLLFLLGISASANRETVATKKEIVAQLLKAELNAAQRFAGGIYNTDCCLADPMSSDTCPSLG